MFTVTPLEPTIGALVTGFRAQDAIRDGLDSRIREAFLDRKLLAFRDQSLTTQEFLAFAKCWGPLAEQVLPERTIAGQPEVQVLEHDEDHPPEYEWHTDLSWHPTPPLGAILLSRVLPTVGGDTLFADMTAAYDGLSERMKRYLDGLVAIHDRTPRLIGRGIASEAIAAFRARFAPQEHPVVRTHPQTGRKAIFVNPAFTMRVKDLQPAEGASLLAFLYAQAAVPEVQCRIRWEPGMMIMWDNRAVQHYAVSDYWPQRRSMERIVLAGDRPR